MGKRVGEDEVRNYLFMGGVPPLEPTIEVQ